MEDLKSSEHCYLKTISLRGSECLVSVGEEIVLDSTGNEMACVKEKVNTLPQTNCGFEKNVLKISRTKPQMLGSLTFREIAEKRKDMLKSSSVKHTENDVPSSTLTLLSDSSLKPDKRDEEKSLENETTYINPHMLVGKTIKLEQGDIRHIKFLSQDSNTLPSNRKLLKFDSIQLTPKIIVRKSKPGCFSSNQTQINHKDLKKIQYHKTSKRMGMFSVKNSVELNFQPRLKSLPQIHSISHNQLSCNTEKELARNNSGLLMRKSSYEKDVYNCSSANFVDIQREREGNVTKCSLLNSSHDNLTILSQVACGEFEMNKQLGSKEETKDSLSLKDQLRDFRHNPKNANYEFVSLDHSYDKRLQPVKVFHGSEYSAKVRPMNNKTCTRKSVENIILSSSHKNKRNFEEKPMFAWCTQYITHSRFFKTNDYSVSKELSSNQQQKIDGGNKKLPKSLNSNDDPKRQHSFQKQDNSYKSDEVSKKSLNFTETSKETLTSSTPHTREKSNCIMLPKSQFCSENEKRNDSCLETAAVTVDTLLSSKEKLSEINDEVLILKEILVTKSPNCNAFPSNDSDTLKLKSCNKRYLCSNDYKRSPLESDKTSSIRKILTEIPANEEKTSKLFHKSNGDNNVAKPWLESSKPSITNTSSQKTSKDMNGNGQVQKIRNIHNPPLKALKSHITSSLIKAEESHKYTRQFNTICTSENIKTDSVLGKTSHLIKKCFVLVERLSESTPLIEKVTGIASSTSSTNVNEICCDFIPPNICSEMSVECFKEGNDKNPVTCLGNYSNFRTKLHCEENRFHPENNIGEKQHIVLGHNAKTGCKRKIKILEQEPESFITSKKVKLPRGRPKKFIAKNIKTTMKNGNKLKTKPYDVKVKTEHKRENNSINKNNEISIISNQNDVVPVLNMNGNVKRSPEKIFSGNREIYSLLTDFTTLGCSIEPERKLRRRSANIPQKSVENIKVLNDSFDELFSNEEVVNKITQNNVEMHLEAYGSSNEVSFIESNNNKSQSINITPLKQNNYEVSLGESLDTAEIDSALTRPTPNIVINKSTPVSQCYRETSVLNQSNTTQDDLQIGCNFVSPMQQNILKCDKLPIDHSSSQFRNNGKSADISTCSQNVSSRPKRLKPLDKKNVQVPRSLNKGKKGVGKLKRRCVPLCVGRAKRKSLDFSRSDTENKQDNVNIKSKKVQTKSNMHTLEKCSYMVSNVIQLPINCGKKKSVTRNRLKNTPSASSIKIKEEISNFSSQTDCENLQVNFEQSIQSNDQRCTNKLSCDKINGLKNGRRSLPKAKKINLSRQMRQNFPALSRSCVLNSKQKCHISTDVALHDQTSNLKYAKKCFGDDVLLLADSSKSSLEFPSTSNCSGENKQFRRVRRKPSLNSQTLKDKYLTKCVRSKSKSNALTSKNRKFGQKVTTAQDISNNQIDCINLSESNSTTLQVSKQECSDFNEFMNHSVVTCARLNKSTQNLPIPLKTSLTNNLQPRTECSRKKPSSNNLSPASSSINIRPVDLHTCINSQDSELTTKVKCSSTTSRQDNDKHKNNQISPPSTVHDKIRLLLMEKLKRSRRGHKKALEKAPPKK